MFLHIIKYTCSLCQILWVNCMVSNVKVISLSLVNLYSLKKKMPLKKENERMKERIAGKINREELSIYSSIYSSYPFLSLKFLSWLAEQTKNTLQTHKLFHQIFSHVSRWKISSLNTDINQEKKNNNKNKKQHLITVLFSDQDLSVTYRNLQVCFKKPSH